RLPVWTDVGRDDVRRAEHLPAVKGEVAGLHVRGPRAARPVAGLEVVELDAVGIDRLEATTVGRCDGRLVPVLDGRIEGRDARRLHAAHGLFPPFATGPVAAAEAEQAACTGGSRCRRRGR